MHGYGPNLSMPAFVSRNWLAIGRQRCIRFGCQRVYSAQVFCQQLYERNSYCSCSHMIYIGELCRYLTNIPEQADDAKTPLHSIMGNVRPDILDEFQTTLWHQASMRVLRCV